MSLIEIFRAGRHTAMSGETVTFGAAELDQLVSSYDPALHEAPLVVGHPKHDSPAYGWVKALSRTPALTVEAKADQVDAAFAESVRSGRFKKISMSAYRPDSPANPKPGSWYLRHVGFLGAMPPAVKGLKPVELSESVAKRFDAEGTADFVEFAEVDAPSLLGSLRALLVKELGEEEVAKAFAAAAEESEEEEESETPANPAPATDMSEAAQRRAEDLDRRERRLAEQEARLEKGRRAERRRTNEAFLEQLVAKGKPLPCSSAVALSFLELLEDAEVGAVSFGEGEERAPAQIFREDILARIKTEVDFEERGAAGAADVGPAKGAEAIAKAAEAYQEEQAAKGVVVTTIEAVAHVRQKRN